MYKKVLPLSMHLDFHPLRVARKMGLSVLGRGIVCNNEIEEDALMNFQFSEYRVNGKTLAQTVDPAAAGLTPLESEIFEQVRQSTTSFYQVVGFEPESQQIRLRDLLDSQAPEVTLTDVGLSRSMAVNGVRFAMLTRTATVRGLTMTNGTSFTFHLKNAPGLLQAYRQKIRRVPPEQVSEFRFIYFFQKHRQIGIEQTIRDVI
jgi:hypothetical protein